MIEYSFWVKDKVDGVEALVFKSEFDQNSFTSHVVLSDIVGQHPEDAKATTKAVALPDPVLPNRIVYNGKRTGRKYETIVNHADDSVSTDVHKVVGVRSIPYPTDRGVKSIEVYELKGNGKKQVFELVVE